MKEQGMSALVAVCTEGSIVLVFVAVNLIRWWLDRRINQWGNSRLPGGWRQPGTAPAQEKVARRFFINFRRIIMKMMIY